MDNQRASWCPKCMGMVSNDFDESLMDHLRDPDEWDDRDEDARDDDDA
jgi:hypothetical protein